jgi:hypothetical protein
VNYVSLTKTIKTHPAVGWVRANQPASEDLLRELNDLRKHNEDLIAQLLRDNRLSLVSDIAGLDERITVHGKYGPSNERKSWSCTITWGDIFGLLGPYFLDGLTDGELKNKLTLYLFALSGEKGSNLLLIENDYQTLKIQFMALGLMKFSGNLMTLTDLGHSTLLQLRAIKTKKTQ